MKSTSIRGTLLGILLAMAFYTACSARTTERPVQSANANAEGQQTASADQELLSEVQKFASSDERESASAWQSLQSRNRSKLIEDLTRLSNASAPDDRNRILIAFTFCSLSHEYASNRKLVLSALSRNPPFKQFFGDWAVSLVGRLMVQGDRDLLVPLFEVSEWSDGAMSSELAGAYSRALATDPESFLRMLSSQPKETADRVTELLKSNNLTAEESTKVRAYLKNVPRQSKLALIAKHLLEALTIE